MQVLIGQVLEIFACKLVTKNSTTLNMKNLIDHQKQIIVIYGAQEMTSGHDFLFPRSFCPNPWANTMNIGYLFQFLDDKLSHRSHIGMYQ
jgi:hypothetical protein